MGYDLTLAGLLRKREELATKAEVLRAQTGDLLSALDHIDAVIRIFKPDIDLSDLPARLAPPALSGTRGDLQRFLLDQLRQTNRPLNTFELADALIAARRLDANDRVTVKLMQRRVGYGLAKLRKAGKATSSRAHR